MIEQQTIDNEPSLDELRPGSVIIDSRGTAFQKWDLAGWQSAGPTLTRKIALPATLIHKPEAAQ